MRSSSLPDTTASSPFHSQVLSTLKGELVPRKSEVDARFETLIPKVRHLMIGNLAWLVYHLQLQGR
jgi:hypothetical protein